MIDVRFEEIDNASQRLERSSHRAVHRCDFNCDSIVRLERTKRRQLLLGDIVFAPRRKTFCEENQSFFFICAARHCASDLRHRAFGQTFGEIVTPECVVGDCRRCSSTTGNECSTFWRVHLESHRRSKRMRIELVSALAGARRTIDVAETG